MNQQQRMQELIAILNEASRAYYSTDQEIMSNREYDELYEELENLEKETGTVLSNSPTQRVGDTAVSELSKVAHAYPMLSLDKIKDVQALKAWLGDHTGLLSWKLDGLTIVLTYRDGRLAQAVTRGNGKVGEDITNNARVFENVPLTIPYQNELVVRGEALITYADFARVNQEIEGGQKYKNPRNLCSGSVRLLNSRVTRERHVRFVAFTLVAADEDFHNSRLRQMDFLRAQGFVVVQGEAVRAADIVDEVARFTAGIAANPYPCDGLVLAYDDLSYSQSLGRTAKFYRDSIAFKWTDETRETRIKEIVWSASRTGLINPVAVFEPVELEGTTVSRASLHNVSILESLRLGIGDTVTVYKANMIIPQIAENLDQTGPAEIPKQCPVCGAETTIKDEDGVRTLYCPNPDCQAKHLKRFAHFVSRDAMNVAGLSEMTLEKLIDYGYIKEFADLFHLERYQTEIENMEGFGKKSFQNLLNATTRARATDAASFLNALGIPNIGLANARLIAGHFHEDLDKIIHAAKEELLAIDGIGAVKADSFVSYMQDEENQKQIQNLRAVCTFTKSMESSGELLKGLTFCVTGSLEHFPNRQALKAEIEKQGGKVTGSVSAKTSYLINNDLSSSSGKNQKARQLNIPIIDEETIISWLEGKRSKAE